MKKILVITTAVLLFFLSLTYAGADRDDNPSSENSQRDKQVEVDSEEEENDTENEIEDEDFNEDSEADDTSFQDRNTIRKLNRIMEQNYDSEVDDEVEDISSDQEEIENSVRNANQKIEQRPAYVRFLIGPDYKNLGQLRKQQVNLRNNIRRLEQLRVKASEQVAGSIDEAIAEMEATSLELQTNISEKLSGFSLFGWLFRWLSGYNGAGEASPSPSATASPSPTVSATSTPVVSPTETAEPTSTSLPL